MVFTIEEIKNYLASKKDLAQAITDLSEQAIVDCIDVRDFNSLNYVRDNANLEKYESTLKVFKQKEEQKTIYRNSQGQKGKYWMALSPKWLDENSPMRKDTAFEISYWVNYGDNETYGHFTVEQIMQWLASPKLKLYKLGGTRERVVSR